MLAGDFKPNCALGTSSRSSSELLKDIIIERTIVSSPRLPGSTWESQ